ncbi:putative ABC transporter ATP-binding protein [Desulfovibrionales bacterium]
MTPPGTLPSTSKRQQLLFSVAPFHRAYCAMLGINLMAALFDIGGLTMIFPFLESILVNTAMPDTVICLVLPILDKLPGQNPLLKIVCIVACIVAIKHVLQFYDSYLSRWVILRTSEYWQNKLMERYLRCDFAFFISCKQGELINNITTQSGNASLTLTYFNNMIVNIIFATAFYSFFVIVNWKLAAILTFIFGCFYLFFERGAKLYTNRLGYKKIEHQRNIFSEANESLLGFQLVKAYSLETLRMASFRRETGLLRKLLLNFHVVSELPRHVQELFALTTLIGILQYMTNFDVGRVRMVMPQLVVICLVLMRIMGRGSLLVDNWMRFQNSFPSLSLIYKLINHDIPKERNQNTSRLATFKQLEKDIVFDQVNFSYTLNRPVLNKLSITIPRGKITAIIGPSGVGKSTLANLLIGFLLPNSGNLLINDQTLTNYDLDTWRQKIGYVGQDTIIFNNSILENIRLGRTDATDEEIYTAAKKAALNSFIEELPNKYLTFVGDRGLLISGGQRQRIAIARAILRDPELYIFDEATSALDTTTEKKIHLAIEEIGKNRTVLIITHRLTAIENADVVYDLSQLTSQDSPNTTAA